MMLGSGCDDAASVSNISHGLPTLVQELLTTYEIPGDHVYKFTSYKELKEYLTTHADFFLAGETTTQYLAISDVHANNIRMINDRQRRRSDLPSMRILYDHDAEMLIVKLIPGIEHELAASLFVDIVGDKIASTGASRQSILDFGGALFGVQGGRQKEGDRALRPDARTRAADWPSMVVEVGVSESLSQLRGDAHFWLTRSGGQTRIVILISIAKTTKIVTIERWENLARTQTTRASSSQYNPTKMQTLTLQSNGQITGGPLLIPAAKLFDTVPPGVGQNDFQLDDQLLTSYIQMYWSQLN